jgi:hypothetical protein
VRVPWRFIVGLVLGVAIAIAVFIGAIYSELGVPTASSQWIHDITQRQIQLANRVTGPRLLIVAGSGGLFGINAAEIQRVTGYPTFNLSTHAGLLIDYRLDRLKQVARPGDIILFAWEYEQYERLYNPDTLADYIIAHDPAYFRQMPLTDKIALATRLPLTRLQKGWRNRFRPEHVRKPTFPYSPYTPITPGIDCLDDNGDEVFNTDQRRKAGDLEVSGVLLNYFPWTPEVTYRRLTSFIDWARGNHITVLATFPNIFWMPGYDLPPSVRVVDDLTHYYQSHGVPVIGTAQEAMLRPRADFLDTYYHLTHEAAVRRTDRLIPELRPYLPAHPVR